MIDIKTIRELLKLMVQNDLTELDLQDEKEHVTFKRAGADQQPVQYFAPPAAAAPQAATATAAPDQAREPVDDGLIAIASPMVGTYYAASSPDANDFVSVGSKVSGESVVCIIEAMKVFNEIKAEIKGTIAEVLVENGQAVEFGQTLFKVKPN